MANATNGLIGAISVSEPSAAVLGVMVLGVLAGGRRMRNRGLAARS